MDSFQAKIGWERPKKRENKKKLKIKKKNRYDEFLPDPGQIIPKKFQKLKNTIMTCFQAKISWKRLRKSENKKIK